MTIVLLTHILSFSISLMLMPLLLIASLSRFSVPRLLRFSSLGSTIVGLTSGAALLVGSPSGTYCAILFIYVVVFGLLYVKSSARTNTPAEATVTIDR